MRNRQLRDANYQDPTLAMLVVLGALVAVTGASHSS